MKNNLIILTAAFVLSYFGILAIQPTLAAIAVSFNPQSYNGVFQHMPEHQGSKIEFQQVQGALYINFEGVEYFGEHGVGHYFYAGRVKPLEGGGFSFEVPTRTFYASPVRSGQFLVERGWAGRSIQFSGKIEAGKLVISCQSEDESACFDKTMIFQPIK
jgi:hypothetical protein